MQDSSNTLSYECPNCHKTLEIQGEVVGEKVDCPKCDHPFVAEAPRAQPVTGQSDKGTATTGRAREDAPRKEDDEQPLEQRGDVVSPANDEKVVRVIHPTVFRRHIFGTIGCGFLALVGAVLLIMGLAGMPLIELVGLPLTIIGGLLLLIGGFFIVKWYILSRVTSLTLTSDRIIYTFGIIHRRTSEMRHDDVLNMKMEQNLLERILHFGDIAISSAGQDGMEIVINDIPRPNEVAEFIRKRQ